MMSTSSQMEYTDTKCILAALKMKKQIAGKFKDAFIIAFLDGRKINTSEAIGIYKKEKK